MGARFSTDRGGAATSTRQPGTLTFAARGDDITDDLLARVAEARTRGDLRVVTLDCRRCLFDEAAVDKVFCAAGGKVVLDL